MSNAGENLPTAGEHLAMSIEQGYSINGQRAKSGQCEPNNWPAEQSQNVEKID